MGLTFDTGALIALERRRLNMAQIFARAHERRIRIVVPSVVVAEWWRGRSDLREDILHAVELEPLSDVLAKIAGEAMAAVPDATPIDAIVMASAAQRGDTVYTSDPQDLARLHTYFPTVKNILTV